MVSAAWRLEHRKSSTEISKSGHEACQPVAYRLSPVAYRLSSQAGDVPVMGAAPDPDTDRDRAADHEHLVSHYNELAELAGSLAHEIKNPLSVIRMNMDLLAEDLAEAETPRERRARAKIDVVHDQCTRLENLLNDFLKFARVRSLDLVPGNLNEQLLSVLAPV